MTPVSPATFRRIAAVAWLFQALIVASGAAVRLTQAGLGCEDWPRCNEESFTPEWELHGWIEFGNRLISLVVTLTTVAVIVGAYRRRPRRQDLIRLGWLLVAGTVGQVVLGGITVLLDLNPIVVSIHFLVSMALLFVAHLLWRRADPAGPAVAPEVDDETTRWLLRAQLPLAGLVLVTGTLVTGSGPNSGDARADRLGFELRAIARVHSVSVWLLLACIVGLLVLFRTRAICPLGDRRCDPWSTVHLMALVAVAQGGIGYLQFALGVPPALVEVHVIGAVLVWMLAVTLFLRTSDRPDEAPPEPTGSDRPVAVPTGV